MPEFAAIAVVVVALALVSALLVRRAGMGPERAAEPLGQTVRNFLLWVGYFGAQWAVAKLLPPGPALAMISAITLGAMVIFALWQRLRPSVRRGEPGSHPPATEVMAFSASDRIFALVGLIAVAVVIALLTQVTGPR